MKALPRMVFILNICRWPHSHFKQPLRARGEETELHNSQIKTSLTKQERTYTTSNPEKKVKQFNDLDLDPENG